ncbi:hypothetical protein Ssi02_23780 [Sinosporangium siamense]|uniref:HTH tetR-type domain-containing protein n=1 Tax=Sinosporangium siamense TaxID=1367973 RepID=A0A919V7J2_9ACTN|nr:hypothetical protein Ssi02_23780 [Sinosporangium siamense]
MAESERADMAQLETLIANGRKHGVRKRVILLQAARLFVERGYAATGIDDIGAAAGVTGPAVYRHFRSKQAILIALIELSIDRMRDGMNAVLEAQTGGPEETVVAVVDWFVEASLENQALTLVLQGELPRLPDEDRRRFNDEMQTLRDTWVNVVTGARPEMAGLPAQMAVVCVMGMATSVIAAGLSRDTELIRRNLRSQMLALMWPPAADHPVEAKR